MPRASRFTLLRELEITALDLETTGLDVRSDRVVQIGAIRVSRGEVRRDQAFSTFVDPGVPISPGSTALHGIDDATVRGAPDFGAAVLALAAFAGDTVIVGQSVGFDLAVLFHECARAGVPWRRPQFLDTKLLASALEATETERGLDEIAARLGVVIEDRHSASGDARVTAEVFCRLIPRLEAEGIHTLAEAQAHASAQHRLLARQAEEGWYDSTFVRSRDGFESGADRDALARLARRDSFAYRHRVENVMVRAPRLVPPSTMLEDVVRLMAEEGLDAVLAGDPSTRRVDGLVSERVVVEALARMGVSCLEQRLEAVMIAPVAALPRDAFVYRAVGRMQRLGVSHLVIEDAAHRAVGLLSDRALLRDPTANAVALGDRLSSARTTRELAALRAELPGLARRLLDDGIDARDVADVTTFELRELVANAAALAERQMESEGAGRPPVPYALLLLGATARGEALLDATVQTAIVFESGAAGSPEDAWFQDFTERLESLLRAAGVRDRTSPGAAGAVRRASLEGWRTEIARWARSGDLPVGADELFDMRPVFGDLSLATDLHDLALRSAAASQDLIERLAAPALGAGPVPVEAVRVDVAALILEPIAAAARAIAVACESRALSTPERLVEVRAPTRAFAARAHALADCHGSLLRLLLDQQLADVAAGLAPGPAIELARLSEDDRGVLDDAIEQVRELPDFVLYRLAAQGSR